MVLLPSAQNRQLAGKSTTSLQQRFINVHTMVGTLAGTESFFAPSGRPYSHYGVGGNGAVWQWQDPSFRAASDLEGNPYSISFETEDKGPHFPAWTGSDVPAWTPAQIEALVAGIAWLCVRYGIPPVQLEDSLPIPDGLSYHRLGIDPWRVPGGLRYSTSTGKVCPGDRRINQFRNIVVPRVQALVLQEDDMTPEEHEALFTVYNLLRGTTGDRIGDLWNREGDTLTEARVAAAQLVTATDGRLGDIWLVLQEILTQTAPAPPA